MTNRTRPNRMSWTWWRFDYLAAEDGFHVSRLSHNLTETIASWSKTGPPFSCTRKSSQRSFRRRDIINLTMTLTKTQNLRDIIY